MKPTLPIVAISILLAGCASNNLPPTKTNLQVVQIPSTLVDCDRVKVSIPSTEGLTNRQVGQYIVNLKKALNECQLDAQSVRDFQSKITVELAKQNVNK